jgi:hypothetical protein
MKQEMFEFAWHISGGPQFTNLDLNPVNPYSHWGAPKSLTPFEKFNTNPHGPGYSMHPELTRSNAAGLASVVYRASPAALVSGAAFVGPLLLIPIATASYPAVAGPQYQSAMSGQMNIGSSAFALKKWEHWTDPFTWSYWQGY